MKCFAEDYCQKKSEVSCNDLCGGYRVLRALYNLSKMPTKYRYKIELIPSVKGYDAFVTLNEFKENILANVEGGKNLYIWGKCTGNGKTSWACKIMSHYFRKIAFSSGLEDEGLFIYLPAFLDKLRNSYSNPDPDFEEELDMVKNCKLLIIDDIGAEKLTEWARERIVSIINTRIVEGLSTIYTSNLSPEELNNELGARIYSRIIGESLVVEVIGGDNRGVEL